MLAPITVSAESQADVGYQPIYASPALRTDAPLRDIPQSVNVITQEVLHDQNARSLEDVLGNVSGITQTNTLGNTQDAFIRRGFGQNRDDAILTNGMKTVLPKSFNATTERVEVMKGPSSTLFGIQDPGGGINLVTKRPERHFGGEISLNASSFGGGSTTLDLTGPIADKPLAFRLIGSFENTEYWRNYGKNKNHLIAPSLSWFGADTTVTASYLYQHYEKPFDRGTIWDIDRNGPIPVNRRTRLDERFNITKGESQVASLNVRHAFNDDWRMTFDYTYSSDQYRDNQARMDGWDAANNRVRRRIDATQGSEVSGHAARVDVIGKVQWLGMENELLFGAEYDYRQVLRSDMMRCTTRHWLDIRKLDYGKPQKCTTVVAAQSDQFERLKSPSLYLQDSLHLNEQWIVVAGARYQQYKQIAGRGRPFVKNTDTSGSKVVPRLGLVYKATPALSIYSNIAKSFRPQASMSSYFGDLPPEEGLTYEVGSKWDVTPTLNATLAAYTTDKKNVTYFEGVGSQLVTRTAGKVRARGVELDVAGKLTERVSLVASYAYTNTKVLSDPLISGMRLANVARHTASLFTSYAFDVLPNGDRLKMGAGIRGVSKRAGHVNNSYFIPGYAAVDAFVAYTIASHNPITVQLNLRNLFDRTYFASALGSSPYGNAYGEPFNANLSLSMRF